MMVAENPQSTEEIASVIAKAAQDLGKKISKEAQDVGKKATVDSQQQGKGGADVTGEDFTLPPPPEPEIYDILPVTNEEFEAIHKLLVIDDDNLDGEWSEQAIHYMRAQFLAKRAVAAVLLNKLALRVREAKLGKEFRQNGIPGIEKSTEGAINEALMRDPEVIKLSYHQVFLSFRQGVTEALSNAYEQRYGALKYKTLPMTASPTPGVIPEDAKFYGKTARKLAQKALRRSPLHDK